MKCHNFDNYVHVVYSQPKKLRRFVNICRNNLAFWLFLTKNQNLVNIANSNFFSDNLGQLNTCIHF